jgi:hypothetical protein
VFPGEKGARLAWLHGVSHLDLPVSSRFVASPASGLRGWVVCVISSLPLSRIAVTGSPIVNPGCDAARGPAAIACEVSQPEYEPGVEAAHLAAPLKVPGAEPLADRGSSGTDARGK